MEYGCFKANATQGAGAARARAYYPILGQCEMCEEPAHDRHHQDGNRLNNVQNNVRFL